MRMMSAEWLASGTNPVRLSAKGGAVRGSADGRRREWDEGGGTTISVRALLSRDERLTAGERASVPCQATGGRVLTQRVQGVRERERSCMFYSATYYVKKNKTKNKKQPKYSCAAVLQFSFPADPETRPRLLVVPRLGASFAPPVLHPVPPSPLSHLQSSTPPPAPLLKPPPPPTLQRKQ